MWPLFTRRRRVRWLAIALTSILIVWSLIVYKSLTISYPPEPPQRQPVSASSFLFDIDNLDLFLARTPVKYNYHVFYYPWFVALMPSSERGHTRCHSGTAIQSTMPVAICIGIIVD